ncbi:MAG: galactokinase [Firmicutes bacterium]|nr:galactokinase [Bacillota bacterium]
MKIMARAPGRVNLIGEHTDYNLGFVLPMAVNMGIAVVATGRRDRMVHACALDKDEEYTFSLAELRPRQEIRWWSYIEGVCWALMEKGHEIYGADLSFGGNIPIGAGLSSSAAVEVAVASVFTRLNGIEIDRRELALLCQKAENEYVGVMCGIMDQFASTLSASGHALFIDCRSRDFETVPVDQNKYTFMIIDSRVRRSLAHSEYNRRREECEEALSMIAGITATPRESLRDVTMDELLAARSMMPDTLFRRSLYILEENRRVLDAVRALVDRDMLSFGKLMNSSHRGLRDLFEVSCRELDAIVDAAQSYDGVMGARMTGAGFGGCVVALVEKDRVTGLQQQILDRTKKVLPGEPLFYITPAADGSSTRLIEEK